MRHDVERIAVKQAEAETMHVAKQVERLEKVKATQALMATTAAQLKEQGRPQQVERVEYQVLRLVTPSTRLAYRRRSSSNSKEGPATEWYMIRDPLCYSF